MAERMRGRRRRRRGVRRRRWCVDGSDMLVLTVDLGDEMS